MTHATELPSANAMLDAEANHDCAQKIREELARRRLTRQQLAHDAKLSLSTLEKALSGRRPFTLATIIRLEQALGIGLRDGPRLMAALPSTALRRMRSAPIHGQRWLGSKATT